VFLQPKASGGIRRRPDCIPPRQILPSHFDTATRAVCCSSLLSVRSHQLGIQSVRFAALQIFLTQFPVDPVQSLSTLRSGHSKRAKQPFSSVPNARLLRLAHHYVLIPLLSCTLRRRLDSASSAAVENTRGALISHIGDERDV
jgi:hypothetical protein